MARGKKLSQLLQGTFTDLKSGLMSAKESSKDSAGCMYCWTWRQARKYWDELEPGFRWAVSTNALPLKDYGALVKWDLFLLLATNHQRHIIIDLMRKGSEVEPGSAMKPFVYYYNSGNIP